jgi:hypothetical protein
LPEPHGITSQKTSFFIVTAVKIKNLTIFRFHKVLGSFSVAPQVTTSEEGFSAVESVLMSGSERD